MESGELLYNGIRLPAEWPPRYRKPKDNAPSNNVEEKAAMVFVTEPMVVPYLNAPPAVIPIDIGRQLFVDDFLIEKSDLSKEFHRAEKYAGNPVMKPETKLEKGDRGQPTTDQPKGAPPVWWQPLQPAAVTKDGGVWWDDGQFKMWYEAGWLGVMAYATSKDGIHWERPNLDIEPGTNRIVPQKRPDSTAVVIDYDTKDASQRYKMFIRPTGEKPENGYSFVSADGIHWSDPVPTGKMGDRSTMFYNPFRKKWVYSIRCSSAAGRSRQYREHSDFLQGAAWGPEDVVFWTSADKLDLVDPVIKQPPQLYNHDAVAYESLILGLFEIHLGPTNKEGETTGIPKITDLMTGFSRDGFHWSRPDRTAFIPASRTPDSWDRGYLQSAGGICVVVGDKLWFYYGGFRGDPNNLNKGWKNGMYSDASTGIATLRRDGFVSLNAKDAAGTVETRPVTFSGKYLFVNVDCPKGELRAEVLDEKGQVIEPFSLANCIPISADSTLQRVKWKGGESLASLAKRPVRFRFQLTNGALYSFWVSPGESGASHGYVGAGGPGFTGSVDTAGEAAYNEAEKYRLKPMQFTLPQNRSAGILPATVTDAGGMPAPFLK